MLLIGNKQKVSHILIKKNILYMICIAKNHLPTLEGDYSRKARTRYYIIIQKLSPLNQVKHFFEIVTQFDEKVIFTIYN